MERASIPPAEAPMTTRSWVSILPPFSNSFGSSFLVFCEAVGRIEEVKIIIAF
jgi:hypothetical protein